MLLLLESLSVIAASKIPWKKKQTMPVRIRGIPSQRIREGLPDAKKKMATSARIVTIHSVRRMVLYVETMFGKVLSSLFLLRADERSYTSGLSREMPFAAVICASSTSFETPEGLQITFPVWMGCCPVVQTGVSAILFSRVCLIRVLSIVIFKSRFFSELAYPTRLSTS